MNRRDFLAFSAGLSGLTFLKSCNFQNSLFESKINSNTKFLIGNGNEQLEQLNERYSHSSTKGATIFVGGMNDEIFNIPAPGKVHEILKHPKMDGVYFASTKWGREACLVDVHQKKLLKDITCNTGDSFNGHSLFSGDGEFLFASMSNQYSKEDFISVRDTKTFNEIKRITTLGKLPHQIRWFEQDKVIAVINNLPPENIENKEQSIFTFLDVNKGAVLKSIPTSISKHSHFDFTHDHSTALLHRSNHLGDTTLFEAMDLKTGGIKTYNGFKPFNHNLIESLNYVIFEDKSLVITAITSMSRLVFWNYKENKLVHDQPFKDGPICINITEDRKHIVIKFARAQDDYYINFYHTADVLKMDFTSYKTLIGGGNGSHMTIMS